MSQYQHYGGSQYSSAPDEHQYGASNQYGVTVRTTKRISNLTTKLKEIHLQPTQSLQAPAPPSNRISTISQTSHYSQPTTAPVSNTNTHTVYTLQDFLASIDSIRRAIFELTSNISQIGTLHQRGLTDPSASSTTALESAVTQTQILSAQIRDRIKALELDAAKTASASADKKTKLGQVKTLKAGFERELESYRQEERTYLQRYREQIARQYRIVNPGASEAEVEEARNADWGNEGVFQTAVSSDRGLAGNVRVCLRSTDVGIAAAFQPVRRRQQRAWRRPSKAYGAEANGNYARGFGSDV